MNTPVQLARSRIAKHLFILLIQSIIGRLKNDIHIFNYHRHLLLPGFWEDVEMNNKEIIDELINAIETSSRVRLLVLYAIVEILEKK